MRPVDATDARLHTSKPSGTRQGLPPEQRDELLSARDVAAMLKCAPRTVRWWAEIEELPGFKVGQKEWRFRLRDIVAYIECRRLASGET